MQGADDADTLQQAELLEPPSKRQKLADGLAESSHANTVASVGAPASSRVTILFVGGLPTRLPGLRRLLKAALTESLPDANGGGSASAIRNIKMTVNVFNHYRSWAQVVVRDAATAARLIQLHHLRLRLPGTPAHHPPLSVAISQGKLDMQFPFLPAAIRAQLRLDPTAGFSVSDMEYAGRISQLIQTVAAVAQRPPDTPLLHILKVTKGNRTGAAEEAAMAAAKAQAAIASAAPDQYQEMAADEADETDEPMTGDATGAAPNSATAEQRAIIYSPDSEINRLVTRLADCSWSTWTDLEEASGSESVLPPLPPLRVSVSPLTVTDACACAGGNAIDFGRHFARTQAIELDEDRCDDLRANVRLLRLQDRVDVLRGDANAILPTLHQDVVYVDPPWGGPLYKEQMAHNPDANLYLGSTSLTDLCWQLYERDACRIIVLRVPFEYNSDALAARMVAIPVTLEAEAAAAGVVIDPFAVPRPHPFKLLQGKITLLLICLPSREEKMAARTAILGAAAVAATDAASSAPIAAAPASSLPSASPPLHFTLRNLDALIYALNAYNAWHLHECDPAFFDWEKRRWIATRRWRGCTLAPATKRISDEQQRALEMEGKGKKPGLGKPVSDAQMKKKQERNEKYKAKMQAKQQAKQERRQERAGAATVATNGDEAAATTEVKEDAWAPLATSATAAPADA